jgi:hypothetical protein
MNYTKEQVNQLIQSGQYKHPYSSRNIFRMTQEKQEFTKDAFKLEMPPLPPDSPKVEQPKNDLKVLGLDIAKFPSTFQFFLCTIGIFFFYLIYGYFQVICIVLMLKH